MAFILENLNELAQWVLLIALAGGLRAAWNKGKAAVTDYADDFGMK